MLGFFDFNVLVDFIKKLSGTFDLNLFDLTKIPNSNDKITLLLSSRP